MSHTDKVASARSLIEQFNASAPEGKKINADQVFKKLEEAGAVNEVILAECGWEDIERCGVPILLAKAIVRVFRSAVVEKAPETTFVSDKKAGRLLPRELIAAFDPNETDNAIANELDKRSDGKRFLFIDEDGKVNVEASLDEFTAIRRGHTERSEAKASGKIYRLRRAKDRQSETADENPVYKGRALRPDGTCDQTNFSWSGVSTEVRQLVRIAVETGEARVTALDDVKDLIDRATTPNAEAKLRDRYMKSAARFDELSQQGDLPKLRVVIGGAVIPNKNDPFFKKHITY